MNRPFKVLIFGKWIPIVYSPTLKDGKHELHGYYQHETKTIHIATDQPEEEMLVTLIHEIGHALVHLSCHTETFTRKQEETMCQLVENFADLFNLKTDGKYLKWKEIE